jgi:hypothetical protein
MDKKLETIRNENESFEEMQSTLTTRQKVNFD